MLGMRDISGDAEQTGLPDARPAGRNRVSSRVFGIRTTTSAFPDPPAVCVVPGASL
ncbi:hypothetical protein ACFXPA_47820 [Amycolatopsis sp. NPDC059090]|uniref:hypothetical protein n=1 Tax=Amycolatopsis sp. NPDC059090 TaxID=3346723 RepID=UPI00366F97C2